MVVFASVFWHGLSIYGTDGEGGRGVRSDQWDKMDTCRAVGSRYMQIAGLCN